MNACTLFAYWGFNTWVPSYLRAPASSGGIGLSNATMNGFIFANQVGTWFGYVTFGFVSDAIGRKRTYVTYLLLAAGARAGLHVHWRIRWRCSRSARSRRSSRPATSAASAR